MEEMARLIRGLRSAGWSGDEINDFLLYIESGNETLIPKKRAEKPEGAAEAPKP